MIISAGTYDSISSYITVIAINQAYNSIPVYLTVGVFWEVAIFDVEVPQVTSKNMYTSSPAGWRFTDLYYGELTEWRECVEGWYGTVLGWAKIWPFDGEVEPNYIVMYERIGSDGYIWNASTTYTWTKQLLWDNDGYWDGESGHKIEAHWNGLVVVGEVTWPNMCRVKIRVSQDYGNTWENAIIVREDAEAGNDYTYYLNIAIAPDGNSFIVTTSGDGPGYDVTELGALVITKEFTKDQGTNKFTSIATLSSYAPYETVQGMTVLDTYSSDEVHNATMGLGRWSVIQTFTDLANGDTLIRIRGTDYEGEYILDTQEYPIIAASSTTMIFSTYVFAGTNGVDNYYAIYKNGVSIYSLPTTHADLGWFRHNDLRTDLMGNWILGINYNSYDSVKSRRILTSDYLVSRDDGETWSMVTVPHCTVYEQNRTLGGSINGDKIVSYMLCNYVAPMARTEYSRIDRFSAYTGTQSGNTWVSADNGGHQEVYLITIGGNSLNYELVRSPYSLPFWSLEDIKFTFTGVSSLTVQIQNNATIRTTKTASSGDVFNDINFGNANIIKFIGADSTPFTITDIIIGAEILEQKSSVYVGTWDNDLGSWGWEDITPTGDSALATSRISGVGEISFMEHQHLWSSITNMLVAPEGIGATWSDTNDDGIYKWKITNGTTTDSIFEYNGQWFTGIHIKVSFTYSTTVGLYLKDSNDNEILVPNYISGTVYSLDVNVHYVKVGLYQMADPNVALTSSEISDVSVCGWINQSWE